MGKGTSFRKSIERAQDRPEAGKAENRYADRLDWSALEGRKMLSMEHASLQHSIRRGEGGVFWW